MYRNIWKNCHKSVCQLTFYSASGIKLVSITGFKANREFIITDEYIYKIYKASEVLIRFVEEDGITEYTSIRIQMNKLKQRMIKSLSKDKIPFAVIHVDFEEFKNVPSLKMNFSGKFDIGQPIALLGYQLEQDNLAIKQGIITSALYKDQGYKYIQVDSSVKQGNSGAPVINAETLEVIGIIGHRLAAITQSHKKMKQIINKNLAILKKSQGKFNVEEIDPIQVLIANQNQIKHIANEIYKSANMRVGYALDVKYVQELFEEYIDVEISRSNPEFRIDA